MGISIKGLAVLVILSNAIPTPVFSNDSDVRVNQDRLEYHILTLGEIGKDQTGATSRLAYSQFDLEGRAYAMRLMNDAGLKISIDAGGNVVGTRLGKDPSLKPIMTGSHIDTVPEGGNYDGVVGSLSAIEVAKTLNENNVILEHTLKVVIFTNEEGGHVGSRAISGRITEDMLNLKSQIGLTHREGIKKLGGKPGVLNKPLHEKGDLFAFIELHVEQGGVLDKEGINIGVVTGIVGIRRWLVDVIGEANHAGTTQMASRRDALVTAAMYVLAVNKVALGLEGNHVATVGRLAPEPDAINVVPGKVRTTLEIRDLSAEKIQKVFEVIEKASERIADRNGTKIIFNEIQQNAKPAPTNKAIQDEVKRAARELGLSFSYIPSGAGHDAQEFVPITPTSMIFVPSKGGVSHSGLEFTSANDIANGANVLLKTILAIDKFDQF